MKFATKLTILVLGIVVTFAAIISYVVYTSNVETLEKEIKGRLEDAAFHTIDKIDRMLFERYADIKVIAGDPVISSRDSSPRQIRKELVAYRDRYKTYISLSLFDLNRIALADTAGLNIGDQDIIHGFWKDVIQGKTSAASSIELSKSLRTTVIYFASPVKDKNGEIFAVVVARIPLSKLYYVVREAGGIQEGHEELKIDLVDKDGLLLYSNYNRGGILKNNLSDWEAVQRVKAGKQRGSKRHKHLGKEETIYAFAKEQGYLDFEGNDWTLFLHIPTKIAFAPAVQLRNRMIAILSVITVLTVVISLIFSRTISGPIINLKNTAVEIGKGKLDTKIEIASRDEIGELAASFNEMAGKLKESYAHLEEKVKERTSELALANTKLKKEIVERRQTEEALEISNRELKDFVYIASHDLREPLRKVSSFGELLKDSLEGKLNGDDQENLEFMVDGANRMTEMIEGLLTYSRVNTKGISFQAVNLNEVVEQLEQLELAVLLEETGGTIEVPQPLPTVEADPIQMRQLLQNLIANGIRYRRDGVRPRIVIRAKHTDEDKVRIEVQDNGIGIRQEHCEDIFMMFRRLHPRQRYGGTGIGLAVCRKIVDRHGGRIGVESKYGEGATLWFTLSAASKAVAVS